MGNFHAARMYIYTPDALNFSCKTVWYILYIHIYSKNRRFGCTLERSSLGVRDSCFNIFSLSHPQL